MRRRPDLSLEQRVCAPARVRGSETTPKMVRVMSSRARDVATVGLPELLNDEPTFWERVALTRWGSYLTGIERSVLLKAVAIAGRPGIALEIGSEGGRWAELLMREGWQMVCTDVRADIVELCQKRMPAARCVLVKPNATTIPADTGTIDMVLCIEVPPVTSAGWFVQETFRVLRPGGLLVGATENRSSYRAVVHRLFRRRRSDVGFYRTSYPDLRNRLRREGFALLHEEGCCWLPFGRSSDSAFIPALARLEGRMGLRRLAAVGPWVAYIVQKK
jgi:SAM-dependent methyltransferase